MSERIIVLILPVFYLSTFSTRNLLVKKRTQQVVRGRSRLLMLSIILSTLCFIVTILSTYFKQWYYFMGTIAILTKPLITYSGFLLFLVSVVFGWIVSGQLKDSWRVGVIEDQKTELVKTGIYTHVRNPYFLSYYLMFFSLFLVRPSFVLLGLVIATATVFHLMVLKEEQYLLNMHGQNYIKYKSNTGRYMPRLGRGMLDDT